MAGLVWVAGLWAGCAEGSRAYLTLPDLGQGTGEGPIAGSGGSDLAPMPAGGPTTPAPPTPPGALGVSADAGQAPPPAVDAGTAVIARDAGVGMGDLADDPGPEPTDECPDNPDKTAPGVCGCDAPDVDSDGDGVLDCDDPCVDDAADACLRPPSAPPDSSCNDGQFEGRTYWFCTDNRDWDPARSACQGVGGDLVSINTAEEQAFIDAQTGGGEWLIGLNQKNASGSGTPGTWEWVDGGDPNGAYSNWNSGEPDGNDCGVLNGGWRDISCSNGENWICEVP